MNQLGKRDWRDAGLRCAGCDTIINTHGNCNCIGNRKTETQEVLAQVLAADASRKQFDAVITHADEAIRKAILPEDVARTERPAAPVEGRKLDEGKAPWHLAPWDAFLCIVKVLAFGALKYDERNWELGMQWSRIYSACMRHLTDWFQRVDKGKGPGRDADTGYSDLWHAGCCICFLIAYELRGMHKHDDRPSIPKE